jgi:plastocyanin
MTARLPRHARKRMSPLASSLLTAFILALSLAVSLSAAPSQAQTVAANQTAGRVIGQISVQKNGKPKPDASEIVVYVVGFKQKPAATVPKMAQTNRQFAPRVLPITAGQKIDFPNIDKYFHNVFSLSKARRFDLGQYKKGRSKTKTFPRKGIVEVYCNIHPQMSATILVLPNRAFAVTDKSGKFRINGVPPGEHTMFAYSRHAVRPVRAKIKVTAGQTTPVNLVINEDKTAVVHKNKYGENYRTGKAKY